MNKLSIAAALAAFAMAGSAAQAATITFDEMPNGYSQASVISGGYQFTNSSDEDYALFSWGIGSYYSADPTGQTLNNNFPGTTTTVAKVGGGQFDFYSVDLADVYNAASGGNVLFSFFDGTNTVTQTVSLDANAGFETFVFNKVGLTSFSYLPTTTSGPWIQTDNFVMESVPGVSAVPEPATWAMMIMGFGLAGSALRRRRAGVAFA